MALTNRQVVELFIVEELLSAPNPPSAITDLLLLSKADQLARVRAFCASQAAEYDALQSQIETAALQQKAQLTSDAESLRAF